MTDNWQVDIFLFTSASSEVLGPEGIEDMILGMKEKAYVKKGNDSRTGLKKQQRADEIRRVGSIYQANSRTTED